MSDNPTTRDDLLTLYADCDIGCITASDGRQLINSVFGWLATVDPTQNNDSVDTSGIGAKFSAGSVWINQTTFNTWLCTDGTPMNAHWQTVQSPLRVKGDLYGFSLQNARVPVGNDGRVLQADSGQGNGLAYSSRDLDNNNNKIINLSQANSLGEAVASDRVITAGLGLSGGGDLTTDRTISISNTGVVSGPYGDSSHVASFTVNSQGQLTSAGNVSITGFVPSTRDINTTAPLAGGGALSSDLTLSLDNSGVSPATYGDSTHVAQVAVDAHGLITSASNVAISTYTSPLTTLGDILGHSSVDARIPVSGNGQVLMGDSLQTLGVGYSTTNLDVNTHKIINLVSPTLSSDAATKGYADGHLNGDLVPTNQADGFVKRNSSNNAWEEVPYGSTSDTVCMGNDSRLSNGRAPTGSAGGDLSGSYPNPTVSQTSVAFSFNSPLSASLSSSQNDYNPSGLSTANFLKITSTTNISITGLQGGSAGRIFLFSNEGSNNITFPNESSSSSAAHRFDLIADLTIIPGAACLLFYDDSMSRWKVASPTNGSLTSITAGTGLSGGTITTSGTISLSTPVSLGNGGTGTNLGSTGGSNQFLKQLSSGGTISVATISAGDISAVNYSALPATASVPSQYWKLGQWMPTICSANNLTPIVASTNLLAVSTQGTLQNYTVNARGEYATYQSAATTNSNAGWGCGSTNDNNLRTDNGFIFSCTMEFPNATDFNANSRTMIGVCDAIGTSIVAGDTLNNQNGLMFRVSTSASDTQWQCLVNNGGASAPAAVSSGTTVNATTRYILRIDATNSASIVFSINGSVVATISSNLPTTTTGMTPTAMVRTLANANKNISLGSLSISKIN